MKNKNNLKIPKNLIFSILSATIFVLIFAIIVPGHIQYGEIDDYINALLIQKANFTQNVFISYFLSTLIIFLQRFNPTINFYVLIQLILSALSLIAINYTFFRKFKLKIALIFVCVIDVSLTAFSTAIIQYTQTSAIASVAGILLIISAYEHSENFLHKFILIVSGIFLLIMASLYRFEAFKVVSFAFISYIFLNIFIDILKTHNDNSNIVWMDLLKSNIKKKIYLLVTIVIAITVPFAGNIISEVLKTQSGSYTEYKEYNDARTALIDYGIVPYEGNEEFFNSIDIYSQNDIETFMIWNGDQQFFNADKLKKIADYQTDKVYGSKVNPMYIINRIAFKLQTILPVNPYIPIIIAGIAMLFVFLFIFKIRNHIKYFFPLGLLLLWTGFFTAFHTVIGFIIMLNIVMISVITAFFFNRYHYIYVLFFNTIAFLLSMHLNFSRVNFRAIFIYFSAIICILLYLINFDDLQMKYKKNIGLFTMVFTFVLIGSFAISILTVKNEIREKYGFNSDIISYIETNDKNSYVVINTSNSFYLNYYEPLKSTYIPDNVILATGWYIGSSYTNNLMYENNIKNIYKDIIDKKDKFLIVTEQRNIGYISEYINSHYSEANQEIEFKLIDNQAGYKIYHLESVIK